MYNYFYDENPIYSDCTAEGKCSVDPTIFSWQEIFFYELKQISYYVLKLQNLGFNNQTIINDIIRGVSLIIINADFSKSEFETILNYFFNKKNELKNKYKSLCASKKINCQFLASEESSGGMFNFSAAIKQGEEQAVSRTKKLDIDVKSLYDTLMKLLKSACINLYALKEHGKTLPEADNMVLKTLSFLNVNFGDSEKLRKKIVEFAEMNYHIMRSLFQRLEEKYGEIEETKVSLDIKIGKSLLVSGQNFYDLEKVLEATKDTGFNVYTHNGMILAHQFPHFRKYKHLVGHYQKDKENPLIDFASFKGGILITKSYQQKIEQLLRGRIFTTDVIAGKGISKIKENDFTPLIKSIEETNGFLQDKKNYSVNVGYDKTAVYAKIKKILNKFKQGKIKHFVFVGLINNLNSNKAYFEELFKFLGDDIFVFSLSHNLQGKNVFHLDSFYGYSLVYDIVEQLKNICGEKEIPASVFVNHCTFHTLSHAFSMKFLGVKNIFICDCSANIVNPGVLSSLERIFNIKPLSQNPEKDSMLIVP